LLATPSGTLQHIDPFNFDVAEKLLTFCFHDLGQFNKLRMAFWKFAKKEEGM
jgi:hypothetical protein